MFDIGWSELLVIGVVALVVIGPKDLPEMFRTAGRFTAKARSMARDFQRAMDQAANEAGVKDVAKDLKSVVSARNLGLDSVKDVAAKFEKWEPLKKAAPAATVAAPAAAAPITVAPLSPIAAPNLGPATQALADAQAARKAIADDAAARMKAVGAAPQPAAPAAAVARGRTRTPRPTDAAPDVMTKAEKTKTPRKPKIPKADA